MRAHLLDQTLDTRARVCWWARRVAVAPEVQQEHVVTVGITKGRGGAQPAAVRLKPAMKEEPKRRQPTINKLARLRRPSRTAQ